MNICLYAAVIFILTCTATTAQGLAEVKLPAGTWRVATLTTSDGNIVEAGRQAPTLSFFPGSTRVLMFDGCNLRPGSASYADGGLKLSFLVTTLRYCPGDAFASVVVRALTSTAQHWELSDDTLVIGATPKIVLKQTSTR